MTLPYNGILVHSDVNLTMDSEGRRSLSVRLLSRPFESQELGTSYVVISPADARDLGLRLIEQAARAEAITESMASSA